MQNSSENSDSTVEKDPEFDLTGLVPAEATLQDILSNKVSRVGWKPDLGHLQDAVKDGQFLVPVGGKLLIEYTQCAWRDTTIYVVVAVNPEGGITPPGYVRLWDPNKMQYAATDYLKGAEAGLSFKIPDKSRKWVPGEEDSIKDQLKRRRLRGAKEVVEPTKVVQLDENGNPIKKKRGRPKGSKNKTTIIKEQTAQKGTEDK